LPRANVVQDHLANDAVDGDVGADTERQRKNTNASESRGFTEASQSVDPSPPGEAASLSVTRIQAEPRKSILHNPSCPVRIFRLESKFTVCRHPAD
jgi:hypothetical protein